MVLILSKRKIKTQKSKGLPSHTASAGQAAKVTRALLQSHSFPLSHVSSSLGSSSSQTGKHLNNQEVLLKHWFLGPTSRVFYLAGQGGTSKYAFLTISQGMLSLLGQGPHLENLCCIDWV